MRLKDSFHLYGVITVIFWSFAYVFTRITLQYFSVYSLGFLRYIIASCTLIIIIAVRKTKPPERSDLKWFILSGASGFFLYILTFNKGCETVTASASSIMIATVPIITALLAGFIYKERLKYFQWTGIIISFTGVIVTFIDESFSVNTGLIWLFTAALLLSFYNILQRRLTKRYSAFQTSAFSIFAGTIMLSVFFPSAVTEVKDAPVIQILFIAIMGIFSSALAYLSWSQAFIKAKHTSSVSNYMFATPFFTTILGVLIAKEVPDFSTLTGGIIILTGLMLFHFGDKLKAVILHT